jgi:hypothetical protein
MEISTSAILMSAITIAIVVVDFKFRHYERIPIHAFLGSLATVLFYILFLYGYEDYSWMFLSLIPVYFIFAMVFLYFSSNSKLFMSSGSDDENIMSGGSNYDGNEYEMGSDDEIDICNSPKPKECSGSQEPRCPSQEPSCPSQEPRKTCGCPVKKKCGCIKPKPQGCPVNPISLDTTCGISRYT